MLVSEAAEKYVYINQPGAHVGYYENDQAPYMVEPMNEFNSRVFSGLIFVGPAQSGKTQGLILNTIAYSIKVDPMDMIVYSPTQAAARDFSVRRIDRMHHNSADLGDMMRSEKEADNKFDKHYKSGMILTISWPSRAEFAGRPIGRVVLTDRDRMDDDIEGEGEPFDLGLKRTTTFRSFGMCVAESSPSRPIKDPKWVRKTPHEAPPCKGILSLYNRGDRRRLKWPCPHCGNYFEGNFKMLTWDKKSNPLLAAETVRMICPKCNEEIWPEARKEMLRKARWVKDGQEIDEEGNIYGPEIRSKIASFWLNGVAAAFVTWIDLVVIYIEAEKDFERTGSELSLIKFYNTDLGEPYLPKALESLRLPEVLQARAEAIGGTKDEPCVPEGVRFLTATVDVGQNLFIVQVHGICPGSPFDITIVDRFQIRLSADRLDDDGQIQWVKPGTYLEDWDLITEQVIKRTYPLEGDPSKRMMVKITACDSGGKAGVTANAYEYYRKLRKEGLAGRFTLVKGDSTPTAPRTRITHPDSNNTKTKAAAQGDVPVLMIHSNTVKDMLSNRLDCMVPGAGLVRFPEWLPDWFYAELCVELRTDKGWERPPHTRNEAWDLMYYCIGVCISQLIGVEGLDWNKAPNWCAPWDKNSLVFEASQDVRFALPKVTEADFAAFGKALA